MAVEMLRGPDHIAIRVMGISGCGIRFIFAPERRNYESVIFIVEDVNITR